MEKSKIDKLKLEIDVETIKPYLIDKGYDFTMHNEYDKFAYHVARKDDIRYLAFGIWRYQGEIFGDPDYKYEYGQIIFDINGRVLLDCIKTKSEKCFFWFGIPETYEEIDSSDIFMDDIVLITEQKNFRDLPNYSIYKLENENYTRIGEFNEGCTGVEKTSNGELFINKYGRLYGVRKLKFLNDLVFKDIIGINCGAGTLRYDIKNVCSSCKNDDMKDIIRNTLQKNDLLFAYDYVYSDLLDDRRERATIFTFLDTNGNIACKLYVKSEYEFYSIDVNNGTYEEAKEYCKSRLNNDVKRKIANERRKRTRERNLRCKAYEQMMETVTLTFDESIEPQGFTKVLRPSNNKSK